jgi:tetratricopeptide (TPR) repeat protein
MVSYRTLIILPPLAIYFSKITFLITRKRTNKKEKYVKRAIQKHDYPKPVFGLVILLFLTAISVGLYFNYKESDAPENIWYLKGWWMLTKEKNYPDASESFERHLMINSSDYDAWNYNGVALGKMNRHDEALKSFENAIRINPNEDSFWFNRGIALWAIGRHSDAIESLDRALELNPQNAQALEIRRAIYE